MARRDTSNPCTSKRGEPKKKWATRQAAEFVARQDFRKDGKNRWTYLCPSCLKHHVTTTNPRWVKQPADTLDT
jgi:hypothetical protein